MDIWHCDREGRAWMDSAAVENETYLRHAGRRTRTAWWSLRPRSRPYPGPWPHIHFEVYSGLAARRPGKDAVTTSQLALLEASCDEVFETTGYEVNNLTALRLASDIVFRDGATLELSAVTGSVAAGLVAALDVTINP